MSTTTIKNQLKRSKRILLLLITITTFTNLGYAQNGLSKGFSFEVGPGTSHAPGGVSLNYDLPLSDNFYLAFTTVGIGFRHVNDLNNHSHTLAVAMGAEDGDMWLDFDPVVLLRYSWVKEREIGYSGNWSLNYGAQIQFVRWQYTHEFESMDKIWETTTFFSYDFTLLFYPMPLINLKYQF